MMGSTDTDEAASAATAQALAIADANTGPRMDQDQGILSSPTKKPDMIDDGERQARIEQIDNQEQSPSTLHSDPKTAFGNQNRSFSDEPSRHGARQHGQHHDSHRPIEQRPPPAYSDEYGKVEIEQEGLGTKASVANDGRLDIRIHQQSRRLSSLLMPSLQRQLSHAALPDESTTTEAYNLPSHLTGEERKLPPPLNVVIHVVGSRGDVQPFVALGKVLKQKYHHRVRLATHSAFRDFVIENGLECFNIGGDPAELMAFMVKNPGLMPGVDTLKSGDIGRRRKGMYAIVQGCWRSCIEAGDGTGMPASDETPDFGFRASMDSGVADLDDSASRPFVADAIIANPPSFAHVHCAEKLGIPVHLMFTMPWSPTQAFPHPLANIQSSNADTSVTNFVSYALVEMMTWQGLGDIINRFRERSLGLEPVSLMWAPGMASRLRIPYTYCWSPAVIPKPQDWGPHISLSGFFFLPLANHFTPEPALQAFLAQGPTPIYIGFGSIVVDEPEEMTKLIFDAIKLTGQRALVSKGWGGFGADSVGIPDNVFMLGDVPHDWLFKHVSCVVHHGGAGTTAAGIALGRPTVIVPFFGDQTFWGAMIARSGAGPKPIPHRQLSAKKLASAILEALKPETAGQAKKLGDRIASEEGTENGAQSFHEQLDCDSLRCALVPTKAAVWRIKRTQIRLSAFAATALGNEGLLEFNDLKLYRPREYEAEDGPWDPISGGAAALLGTVGSMAMGVADFPIEILRTLTSKSQNSADSSKNSSPSSEDTVPKLKVTESTGRDLSTTSAVTAEENEENLKDKLQDSQQLQFQSEHAQQQPSDHPSHVPRAFDKALRLHHHSSITDSESSSRRHSRSSSPQRYRRSSDTIAHSNHESTYTTLDNAIHAGIGIGRIVGAGVKSPMDFTLGIARGFHNAPKLYGDDTVRKAEKVTGFQSGLKAAGKEFGYGFFDGITGLITQPLEGAKKEGFAGFCKGFGKGIGGVVLKPGAAIWGLPGYTFKGVYKELQKHFGASVQNYIIAARTAQGYEEWTKSTPNERENLTRRWIALQPEIERQKRYFRHGNFHPPHDKLKTRGTSALTGARSQSSANSNASSSMTSFSKSSDTMLSSAADHPGITRPPSQVTRPQFVHGASEAEFEQAIKASVEATSKGNPSEDEMIEQAIRASVQELHEAAHREEDSQTAVEQAIKASVLEAQRTKAAQARDLQDTESMAEDDAEEQRLLELALHRSLTDHQFDRADEGLENGVANVGHTQGQRGSSAISAPLVLPMHESQEMEVGRLSESRPGSSKPDTSDAASQSEKRVREEFAKRQRALEIEFEQKLAQARGRA